MFFLSLALLGQSVTLKAEPFAAAVACAQVAGSGILPGPGPESSAVFNYYLLQAATDDPQGGGWDQRLTHVRAAVGERARISPAMARGLLPQCDARFPAARRPGPFTLPSPGFERDVMCTWELTMTRGSAESLSRKSGDREPVERYLTALDSYLPRMQAGFAANGYASQQAFFDAPPPAFMRKWSVAANPYVFSEACITALPTPADPPRQ